jgi:hypothetical protein
MRKEQDPRGRVVFLPELTRVEGKEGKRGRVCAHIETSHPDIVSNLLTMRV